MPWDHFIPRRQYPHLYLIPRPRRIPIPIPIPIGTLGTNRYGNPSSPPLLRSCPKTDTTFFFLSTQPTCPGTSSPHTYRYLYL